MESGQEYKGKRQITWSEDLVEVVEIPRIDPEMKTTLFYNKLDFQVFQQQEQKRYDKMMMKQIQSMVRDAMADKIKEALDRGATDEEIDAMMPQTTEEIFELLGNVPTPSMPTPPKNMNDETLHKSAQDSPETAATEDISRRDGDTDDDDDDAEEVPRPKQDETKELKDFSDDDIYALFGFEEESGESNDKVTANVPIQQESSLSIESSSVDNDGKNNDNRHDSNNKDEMNGYNEDHDGGNIKEEAPILEKDNLNSENVPNTEIEQLSESSSGNDDMKQTLNGETSPIKDNNGSYTLEIESDGPEKPEDVPEVTKKEADLNSSEESMAESVHSIHEELNERFGASISSEISVEDLIPRSPTKNTSTKTSSPVRIRKYNLSEWDSSDNDDEGLLSSNASSSDEEVEHYATTTKPSRGENISSSLLDGKRESGTSPSMDPESSRRIEEKKDSKEEANKGSIESQAVLTDKRFGVGDDIQEPSSSATERNLDPSPLHTTPAKSKSRDLHADDSAPQSRTITRRVERTDSDDVDLVSLSTVERTEKVRSMMPHRHPNASATGTVARDKPSHDGADLEDSIADLETLHPSPKKSNKPRVTSDDVDVASLNTVERTQKVKSMMPQRKTPSDEAAMHASVDKLWIKAKPNQKSHVDEAAMHASADKLWEKVVAKEVSENPLTPPPSPGAISSASSSPGRRYKVKRVPNASKTTRTTRTRSRSVDENGKSTTRERRRRGRKPSSEFNRSLSDMKLRVEDDEVSETKHHKSSRHSKRQTSSHSVVVTNEKGETVSQDGLKAHTTRRGRRKKAVQRTDYEVRGGWGNPLELGSSSSKGKKSSKTKKAAKT